MRWYGIWEWCKESEKIFRAQKNDAASTKLFGLLVNSAEEQYLHAAKAVFRAWWKLVHRRPPEGCALGGSCPLITAGLASVLTEMRQWEDHQRTPRTQSGWASFFTRCQSRPCRGTQPQEPEAQTAPVGGVGVLGVDASTPAGAPSPTPIATADGGPRSELGSPRTPRRKFI